MFVVTSFRDLFVAGEHMDKNTMAWTRKAISAPVYDNWWQTGKNSVYQLVEVMDISFNPICQGPKSIPDHAQLLFARFLPYPSLSHVGLGQTCRKAKSFKLRW